MSVRRRKVRTSLYIGVLVGALSDHKQAIALWILERLEDPGFDLDARYTRLGSLKWFNLLLGIGTEYPVFVAYWVDARNRVTVTGLSFGYNPFDDAPQNVFGEVAKRRAERTRRRGGSKDGSKAFLNQEEFFNDASRVWVLPTLPPLMIPHIERLHLQMLRIDMIRVFNGGDDLDPSFVQAATRAVLRRPDQFIEDNVMNYYLNNTIALAALMAGVDRVTNREGLTNIFISHDYDRDSAAGLIGYDADTIAAPTQRQVRAILSRVWSQPDDNADTVKAMLHGVWTSKRAGEDMGWTDERARSLLAGPAGGGADQGGEHIVR